MENFENSHYLREREAESSAEYCSDGGQSAPSKSTHTPQAYLSSGKMTEYSHLSRFGITFALLTGDLGAELLTWYLAAFPARTSAQPDVARESPKPNQVFGWKWRESLVKYDPVTCLWKTRQCSLLGDLEPYSETWPRWGMVLDGEYFQLAPLVHHIHGKDCSLRPTPLASDSISWAKTAKMDLESSIATVLNRGGSNRSTYQYQLLGLSPIRAAELNETMMDWPKQWTDLKQLAMAKFQQWLHSHGGYFHDD